MATMSPSELLDWLEQNQFLSAAQTGTLRPLLPTFADSIAIAKELIRRDWLTPYQINQIMQGKQNQLLIGRYRLTERIGEGAMGQIFKAWSLQLERVVAVKTLTKELVNNDKAMDRFRREVETVSQLNHPNIARVRDAGDAEGRPYLVMDFIEGINLQQRVKSIGPLPIAEAVEYARQACLGLQHAFERGVVHRDIKPSNLIVTPPKANGNAQPLVRILDFGLARFESEGDHEARLTQVGRLLGTIDYVSPEQAQDARSADIRADIYSLGCTLFFLLTGKPPFEGNNMVEKLSPRVTGEAPWVRAVRPEVPPALEEVLRKMMARLPEDRYQTPLEAAQALQSIAEAPIALAMPVAGLATAQVAMALPVSSSMANVPLATPIAAGPPPEANAAFLAMSASGRDMSSAAPAAKPRVINRKPVPVKLVLIAAGACLFSVLLCIGCVFLFWPTAKKPDASIRITKAFLSVAENQKPSEKLKPGDRKQVLVYFERVNFSGPVTISLEDLPPGVSGGSRVLPGNSKEGDVTITVAYGTDPVTTKIRVHAECESAGAVGDEWITLTILPGKK